MSDEQGKLSEESASPSIELWETPVGRRSMLQAGLASAAVLGVGSVAAPGAEAAPRKKPPRVETIDLQFALGHVRGVSRLTLYANGEQFALKRHTKVSRAALRRQGGLWGAIDLSQLTHYVAGVKLPADRGLIVSVRGQRGRRDVLVAQLSHAPRAAVIAEARRSNRAKGSFKHVVGSSRRLARLGLKPTDIRSAQRVAQLATVVDEWTTAVGLTSYHPNIANKTLTVQTTNTLLATPAITDLSTAISVLQGNADDVADFPYATNADGRSMAMINIPIVQNGTVVGYKTTSFKTFRLNPQNDPDFAQAVTDGLIGGIRAVRNDPTLGAVINQPLEQDRAASMQTWVQPQGVLPQPETLTGARKGAGIDIQVKNPGFWYGTQTSVSSGYNNGQVGLTLYNNFVRWVWVYVQYLGKDGNMSINPNATFPNTKYSQSLGLLPQVFTVLGIPVWGQNHIGVTLNYPQGAHTARLLFCGLGSNLLDGNWRQYFPADAYLDSGGNPMIAPKDEVLVPAILTGILTIGMTSFALATDIDIASTWVALRKLLPDKALPEVQAAIQAILDGTIPLTTTETFAATVAAGGATYEDISNNGGSAATLWSILLAFASIIPKVLFYPKVAAFWVQVAAVVLGFETADKIIEAVPFIGQVLAMIEAAGDAITLAEAVTETIVSPWVIENEVTLTYPATVTVNRDPLDATFPATARSWKLEASVDGAVVLAPVTGAVNPNGVLQSSPLVLKVTAPFGGETIQWSVVFLNAAGVQVGAGASAKFVNDDPAKPPSALSITITEIPPEIDSSTVFKRTVTTGFNPAAGSAGGYTWSSQLSDSGTVVSAGIQQVMGTTISTLSGVAGVVWEQGDLFYIRGVPIAQNGSSISLGEATSKGYTRRPFLLLDPFVDRSSASSQGDHVLLEPDPSTTAYHVRKVSLDPTTGAPTWDPTISYGEFLLPISAAALHSSGWVVVVETANGRLGTLLPAPPPSSASAQVVLASYTGGPGTQIGLLSSPIAIAVTGSGTVLVLEAAKSQLSAFDLNGSPVPYFGSSVTRRGLFARNASGPVRRGSGEGEFTLPLVSKGTYLDLGVDGAGQMYLLYHTGDGSAVADYHVDVYAAGGAVIATHSAGVNVPHFAVDYFRSLFAANYDPLVDIATGKPHIDPKLGVIEPSLSRFDPTEVTTLKSKKPKRRRQPKPKRK